MSEIRVPKAYGFVLGGAVLTGFALQYLAHRVMNARKKYKVEYPTLYADEKQENGKAFNCVQRGHQNALETYPQFLFVTLVGGLKYPIPVAVAAVAWCVGRVLYAVGYEKAPEKRYWGAPFAGIAFVANVIATSALSYDLIRRYFD